MTSRQCCAENLTKTTVLSTPNGLIFAVLLNHTRHDYTAATTASEINDVLTQN